MIQLVYFMDLLCNTRSLLVMSHGLESAMDDVFTGILLDNFLVNHMIMMQYSQKFLCYSGYLCDVYI